MSIIEVDNISKIFRVHRKDPGLKGSLKSLFWREWLNKAALNSVSLRVNEGEIVGLVGSNGAGKTTLVKILSGIIHPTSGEARVMGFTPWQRKNEFRRQIGLLMGQKAQLWWDLPAADCFILLREMYRIPKVECDKTLNELADTLNVQHLLNIPVRRLSLGERMKMELIAVLLHRPKVVFLDEPTIGLDITAQKAIRKFLLEYSKEYRPAILITSHYMEDIEQLCERIVIIREGNFIYDGALQKVLREYATHKLVTVQLSADADLEDSKLRLSRVLGSAVSTENETLKLKTPRETVAQTISMLLKEVSVRDISVEEEDIATIIEALMTSTTKIATG